MPADKMLIAKRYDIRSAAEKFKKKKMLKYKTYDKAWAGKGQGEYQKTMTDR